MKQLYLYFGFMSISAGVVGIFLPVMPTTPFLLLSVWFFHKTDKHFEDVILKNKWIGTHVQNYLDNRSMNTSFKWKTILFIWVGLGLSIYIQSNIYIIGVLVLIGVAVSIHILLLKGLSYKEISPPFSNDNK